MLLHTLQCVGPPPSKGQDGPTVDVLRLRNPAKPPNRPPNRPSPELTGAIIITDTPFIKCLPCARNCTKRFTYIILEDQASTGATPWGLCRFPFLQDQ